MMEKKLYLTENIFKDFKFALKNMTMSFCQKLKRMRGAKFANIGNPMELRKIRAVGRIFGMTISHIKLN